MEDEPDRCVWVLSVDPVDEPVDTSLEPTWRLATLDERRVNGGPRIRRWQPSSELGTYAERHLERPGPGDDMKWCGRLVAAFVAALVTLVAAPASSSAPALRLTVDRHVLYVGQQLAATATAQLECTWILTWAGQRQVGHGKTASARFTAPVVTKATRIPVRAQCFPVSTAAPRPQPAPRSSATGAHVSQRLSVTVPMSATATVVVTVLPAGGAAAPPGGGTLPPGNGLPSTGGPPGWLVLAGLGSVLAGAFCVELSRRRRRPRS